MTIDVSVMSISLCITLLFPFFKATGLRSFDASLTSIAVLHRLAVGGRPVAPPTTAAAALLATWMLLGAFWLAPSSWLLLSIIWLNKLFTAVFITVFSVTGWPGPVLRVFVAFSGGLAILEKFDVPPTSRRRILLSHLFGSSRDFAVITTLACFFL